eukprot:8297000-Pyramimonas_sp.AAC.1
MFLRRARKGPQSPRSLEEADRIAEAAAVTWAERGIGGGLRSAIAMKSIWRQEFGGMLRILWRL